MESDIKNRRAFRTAPQEDGEVARIVLARLMPLVLVLTSAVILSALSLLRHDRYASYGFDLGIFDQTIWGYSNFEVLPNTIKGIPNLLGDHFHPILFSLAPLYWLWDDVRVLLIAQAALISSASLPLYYWARDVLGIKAALLCQLAFLLFWGVSAGALADFHELAVGTLAISVALYGALTRRDVVLFGGVLGGFLAKEDLALTFFALALYILVAQKRVVLGATLAVISLVWFSAVVWLIMPALAGRAYSYWTFGSLGEDPEDLVAELLRSPHRAVEVLFDRWRKVQTLAALFGAWLLLPIFSPLLIVALPTVLERFWSSNPAHWSTTFQYSLPLAPILAFATVDTIARLDRMASTRTRGVVGGLSFGVVLASIGAFLLVKPYDEVDAYMSSRQAAQIQACLEAIPDDASVAASNRLVPHLSHRRSIFPLWVRQDQEYLAIYELEAPGKRMLRRLEGPNAARHYSRVCSNGGAVVLQIIDPTRQGAAGMRRVIPSISRTD
jgi:uncharacterized membrane protein